MTSAKPTTDPKVTPELVAKHGLTPEEIRADQKNPRPRTEFHRARNLFGDVERALLLQKLAARAKKISHDRSEHSGQGR